MDGLEWMAVPIVGLVCVGYILPSLVARVRGHNNVNSIALVNLFFGWTLAGWAIALIWAFSDNTRE